MEQELINEEQAQKYIQQDDNEIYNAEETQVLIQDWLEETEDGEWEKVEER